MAVTGGPFSARLAGFYRRAIRHGLPSLDRAHLCLADLSASLQSEPRRRARFAITGGTLFSTHLEFCRLLQRTRTKRVAGGRLFVAGLLFGAIPFAKLQGAPIAAAGVIAGLWLLLTDSNLNWRQRHRPML